MEYKPKFSQPFTLQEASGLDVAIISGEIARLQNSLKHLQETQEILASHVEDQKPDVVDGEILLAIEENKVVIGSQMERISILRMALVRKGIPDGGHYDSPIRDGEAETSPTSQGPGVYL